MHLIENDMKKLFVMLLFLILPGCADDEVNNSAATPIVSEIIMVYIKHICFVRFNIIR